MKYSRSKILTKPLTNQFLRFLFVGGFCASLNILILYILTGILHFHYLVSVLVQTVAVNTIGFYLNKRFTFKKRKDGFWKGLIKYNSVMISSFLIVSILMYFLVDVLHIWYLSSFVIVTISTIIFNFVFHKKWTFNE
jgi:putative flippase GtrA